jgi:hypothetical protein
MKSISKDSVMAPPGADEKYSSFEGNSSFVQFFAQPDTSSQPTASNTIDPQHGHHGSPTQGSRKTTIPSDNRPVTSQSTIGHPESHFDIDRSVFELLATSTEVFFGQDLPKDLKDTVCLAVRNATPYTYMKDGDAERVYRDLQIAYESVISYLYGIVLWYTER